MVQSFVYAFLGGFMVLQLASGLPHQIETIQTTQAAVEVASAQ